MSNERVEEVAKMIFEKFYSKGSPSLHSVIIEAISSLPEFQPGRELTANDIHVAYINAPNQEGWQIVMAAELNKIRAPKADRNASTIALQEQCRMYDVLEKERDELKARCERKETERRDLQNNYQLLKAERDRAHDEIKSLKSAPIGVTKERDELKKGADHDCTVIQNLRKERDELKAQLERVRCVRDANHALWLDEVKRREEMQSSKDALISALESEITSLKSAPIGVTKEQVKAAWTSFSNGMISDDFAGKLAAALSPKWIKTSERMPNAMQKVYGLDANRHALALTYLPDSGVPWKSDEDEDSDGWLHDAISHWQPRYVPSPPKEEESPLVKRIRAIQQDTTNELGDVCSMNAKIIGIIKEFERKGGK